MDSSRAMNFQYGDRELFIGVTDLLSVSAEVIVCPAQQDLLPHNHTAEWVFSQAGPQLQRDCKRLIEEHGTLETGMAVYTGAGSLPHKAVIHAISPTMGEGDEQHKIELAISRSLQLSEINEWRSLAFPVLGTDEFSVPVDISARAMFRSITSFWDARYESPLEKIMVCLSEDKLEAFIHAFRDESFIPEQQPEDVSELDDEVPVGYVDLDEQKLDYADDDESNDWFIK